VVAGTPDSWGLACPIDQREEKRKARGPKLGETQKADSFWFAPGAAKKAGQWRLRTSRCRNHAGLFLDRPKHRSRAPLTENAKSGQVLVRTRGGEKGRPVAAPDEPLPQPCGAVPRSPQTQELRTFNGKRKKRRGFGSHPGRRKRQAVAAPDEPLLQPCGAVPRSPQTQEPRTFNGKRKKRTGLGSHAGR
jgi:hypothetical protein